MHRGGGDPGSAVLVRGLLSSVELQLELRAGDGGLDNEITSPRIQRAALAITGHVEAVKAGRVQILGSSEIDFLCSRAPRTRRALALKICSQAPVCCLVVTRALDPPEELLQAANEHGVPLLATPLVSSACIDLLQRHLDERLAPQSSVHGVLIDVYGLGALLLGESGIGKSECALDLITRGHRLVADDVVVIRRESSDVLVGSGPAFGRHHMEIRGLGLLNIRDLFGISAIRERKFIELVVLMEPWQKGKAYDRLGLEEARYVILEVELPLVRMPVAPGRNLATLVEVATRNQLLKLRGHNAARQLSDRLDREISQQVEGGRPGRRSGPTSSEQES